jgi:hypothetical protein
MDWPFLKIPVQFVLIDLAGVRELHTIAAERQSDSRGRLVRDYSSQKLVTGITRKLRRSRNCETENDGCGQPTATIHAHHSITARTKQEPVPSASTCPLVPDAGLIEGRFAGGLLRLLLSSTRLSKRLVFRAHEIGE